MLQKFQVAIGLFFQYAEQIVRVENAQRVHEPMSKYGNCLSRNAQASYKYEAQYSLQVTTRIAY